MCHQLNLKWNPTDPAARKKDAKFPFSYREVLIPLHWFQWNTEYPLSMDGRPVRPAYHLEKAQIPHLNSTGSLTPL